MDIQEVVVMEERPVVYVFMLILFIAITLLINTLTFLTDVERLILFLSGFLLIGAFVVLILREILY